jgi:Amt family ammonium transporter
MPFFTFESGRSGGLTLLLVLCAFLGPGDLLRAQTATNVSVPAPLSLETPGATAGTTATNTPPLSSPMAAPSPAAPVLAPIPAPASLPVTYLAPSSRADFVPLSVSNQADWSVGAALLTLGSLAGFLFYQCGLTRAKNCGHTSTLLLIGVIFSLVGYWIGGFAVQTGGVGDAHAALAQSIPAADRGALDHELGFMAGNHHWGFMGSSGFFLMTDAATRDGISALFLSQSALLALAVAAAMGAALERGRLLAMAVVAFLIGAVIYPLTANWVWGGGWLASLGREFGLGHGVVDLAGSGVVHETAGTLALVIALNLGARQGRFNRAKPAPIPGHNAPFTILGSLFLLLAWTAANAFAYPGSGTLPDGEPTPSSASLAAVNVLLGGMGGALATVFLGAWRKHRPSPIRLTRGLLGGAVALSAGSGFVDPWAALLIGALAGVLVDRAVFWLESRRIDDPVGAAAIHGAGGAWGLLAVGLFANGTAGRGLNGMDFPVRGLFFGGRWYQLGAQALGAVVIFAAVFVLGYLCLSLVQKILGNRVKMVDEIQGLDWPQIGALGYQPDVESEPASTPPAL